MSRIFGIKCKYWTTKYTIFSRNICERQVYKVYKEHLEYSPIASSQECWIQLIPAGIAGNKHSQSNLSANIDWVVGNRVEVETFMLMIEWVRS